MSDMKNNAESSLIQVNDILKLISENNEFKILVEKVCSNLRNTEPQLLYLQCLNDNVIKYHCTQC